MEFNFSKLTYHLVFDTLIYLIYCTYRTILAALHFNCNLHRETKEDNKGNKKLCVVYPKFKDGEGTVREVREKKNFGGYQVNSK